jgi:hypothetical protein
MNQLTSRTASPASAGKVKVKRLGAAHYIFVSVKASVDMGTARGERTQPQIASAILSFLDRSISTVLEK